MSASCHLWKIVLIFDTIVAEDMIFCENEKSLIDKLRTKIHGVTRNLMTPSVLTEKSW